MERKPRELPTPQARDFAIVTYLAEDLGSNIGASNFIANIDTFVTTSTTFDRLVDDFVKLHLLLKDQDQLQPHFQAMDDEELAKYERDRAKAFYSGEISMAEAEIVVTLEDLKVRGVVNRALQIMAIMGLRQREDEFEIVEKDKERTERIMQIARIMDPSFRSMIEGNPEWFKKRNPALYDMLLDIKSGDSDLSSRYRQLRDEL